MTRARFPAKTMNRIIVSETADPASVAPYGQLIGAGAGLPRFASWPGVDVYGSFPLVTDSGMELLVAEAEVSEMRVSLIERHPKHSQTYLPLNGKPFVMVLGEPSAASLPEWEKLRAFHFAGGCGIALYVGTRHVFPFALENRTVFAVLLRHESHVNTLTNPEFEGDAEGPDLHRRVVRPGMHITVAV